MSNCGKTILVTCIFFLLNISVFAQKITLSMSNVSVKDAIEQLKKSTGYSFYFSPNDLDTQKVISVSLTEATIDEAVKQLLADQKGLSYEINNRSILIIKATPQKKNGVYGRIVDDSGEPLIGVVVREIGTQNITITDSDGGFNFNVAHEANLEISCVGFKTIQIAAKEGVPMNISMSIDTQALDEVVVVGYGVMKKSDLTGASSSVKNEVLQQRTVSSFGQALEGHVSGANITSNSGRPGGRVTMRIRGNSSVSVTNDPLYVVDGVIVNVASMANGTTPIDYLNPADVETVEVLKDASATAIYGARGANGVVMITTKKGSANKGTVLTYDADFSINTLPKKLEVLNSREFLATEDLAYQNAAKYDPKGWANGNYKDPKLKRTDSRLFDSNGNPLYDTDWQDETYRNSFSTTHQVGISNNDGKNNYGFSLGYRNDNGLVMCSWLNRYSGRLFIDSTVKPWLSVGASLNYTYTVERQTDSMGNGGITVGRQMIEELPIIPVKYPDGTYGGNADYPGMEGGNSPVQVAKQMFNKFATHNVLGNAYADINFMPSLTLRTSFGTNIIHQRNDYYGGKQLVWISAPTGYAQISNNQYLSWQFENYLTYVAKFDDKHSLTAMAGISWQHVNNNTSSESNNDFSDDYFKYNNIGVGTGPNVSSGVSGYGLNSYFARINYGYDDRYLLTATARADGSSKFGYSNRYAFFPSVGIAWRINNEAFMENAKAVSNLKLHASVGVTGNSETGAYASQGSLGNYTTIINDSKAIGIGISTLANSELKWEKTTQFDAGLDMGFLNNRVNAVIDFYYKKTTNMLLNSPIPGSSGYTYITKNIGSMENKGIELSIETVNIDKRDFTWTTSFNFSYNKNKVLKLGIGGDDIFPGPDILSSTNNIIREGEPVGSFYGYKRLGTWSTSEEAEAAKYGKLPGDLKLWDKNNDGQINDKDRIILGKGIPDGYGSFSNSFKYKNFDLMIDIQYMFGNDILDISKHSAEDRTGIANSYKTVLNAWTPEHQNTMIAQIRPTSAGYTTNIDSHFVEDGSFIRGKNLVFGYNFTTKISERLGLKQLRIYGSVQNFFLITDYSGHDPEVSDAVQTFAQGITIFGYPKPRTFTIGLNITL